MQTKTTFINLIFIFLLLSKNLKFVRIDVDPATNSLKIQLDQPSPFLVSPPVSRDISPVLTVGILTLDVSKTTQKQLRSKFDRKEFNDFIFPEADPLAGKEEILDVLQNLDKYTMMADSYSKFLTFYKNVYTIPMNLLADPEYLVKLMEGLDGVLLTGGASAFFVNNKIEIDNKNKTESASVQRQNSKYLQTVIKILNKAKKINDSGRVFPVWGSCLGFEAMVLSEAPNDFKFDMYKDIKKTHSAVLTDDSGQPLISFQTNPFSLEGSQMEMSFRLGTQELNMDLVDHRVMLRRPSYSLPVYNSFGQFMRGELVGKQKEKVFYFYHHYGFSPNKFRATQSLMDNFKIISISDQNDFVSPSHPYTEDNTKLIYSHPLVKNIKEMVELNTGDSSFVSAVEHKKYPFYAVQFHPEKPLFDYKNNPSVRHDALAIQENRKFSSFFVQRLRAAKIKNTNNKKVIKKLDKLMTSLSKIQVKNVGFYTQLYLFKQAFSFDV